MMMFATSCAPTGPSLNSGCEWTRTFILDRSDVTVISGALARQLLEHNKARAEICK